MLTSDGTLVRPEAKPRRSYGRVLALTVGILAGLLVLVLTVFWLAARLRESHPRAEVAPSTGRFVQADDVEIFIQEEGPPEGPSVLLIHGTAAWSGIWRETMDTLAAEGFHAIALDLPPFGFSERPDPPSYGDEAQASRIVGVLDALNLTGVTLVGHSFGARPTVAAALRDPARIRTLVLVDPALGLSPGAAASQPPLPLRLVLSTPLLRDPLVAATMMNPLLTRTLIQQLILDPADATDAQVHMVQQQFPVEGTTHAVGLWLQAFLSLPEPSSNTNRALYSTLTMPTLLIWGENDSITPLPQAESIKALIPQAELVVLPHTGHIPAIEDGVAFNDALLGFLKRCQVSGVRC